MPRYARMVIPDKKAVYHVMSRTALDGFPFKAVEKDRFLQILKRLCAIYFVDLLGFCVMDNHFHLLVRTYPEGDLSDDEIMERYLIRYGKDAVFPDGDDRRVMLGYYRQRWTCLSKFVQELKQAFSRYYNKRHNRRGTLWGERFKSCIVENGETLINCLAYIDLNPLRAGIVKRPEDYRWNTLGYFVQQGNQDGFLCTDFGPEEFSMREKSDEKECFRRYRRYVYEAGAIDRDGHAAVIDSDLIEKERAHDFNLSKIKRFRYRTRYFTDSGIIGTKAFVAINYQRFKHHFQSKHEKIPRPVKGIEGLYALKRLSDAI